MPILRTVPARAAALGAAALLTTALSAGLASPAQAADPAPHTVRVINPIAGTGIAASGINDRGQIVGTTQVAGDNGGYPVYDGFLWQHGRMTDLGRTFDPVAINNRGHILGRVHHDQAPYLTYGLWKDGTITELGNLGNAFFVAQALNDRDEVVGYGDIANGALRGFVWRAGTFTVLAPVNGGYSSLAFAINNRGEVAGESGEADRYHAIVWRGGQPTDLGPAVQDAYLINNRGDVVGTRDLNATGHALLLRHGTVVDVGATVNYSGAHAINDRGVIVGDEQSGAGTMHAFVWQHGKLTDLGEGSGVGVNNRGLLVVNRQNPGRVEVLG